MSKPYVLTRDNWPHDQEDDNGYLPAIFEPSDMTKFIGDWAYSLITLADLTREDGRYWYGGFVSNEQMQETPWEE